MTTGDAAVAVWPAEVDAAMRIQLTNLRATLAAGHQRLGWKVAYTDSALQARAGLDMPLLGYLSSATLFESGGWYTLGSPVASSPTFIEPEIAVRVGAAAGGALGAEASAPAIEVIEVDAPLTDLAAAVGGNVFHRGAVLGTFLPAEPGIADVEVRIGGVERRLTTADLDLGARLAWVDDRLRHLGEHLLPGDVVLMGSLCPPLSVAAGDTVTVRVPGDEPVRLHIGEHG